MRRWSLCTIAAVLIAVACLGVTAGRAGAATLVVRVQQSVSLDRQVQELDAQHLLTSSGGNITGSIPALGAFRVEVTDRERFDSVLREKPTGDRFTEEAEKRFSLLEVPNDPGYPQQWWAQAIGLPAVWGMPALTVPTVVAVIDTGLRADAAELSGRVVSPYSFPAESGEDWAGDAMMESR